MSDSNHVDSVCGNQNVHLKFLKQYGRQFRLHYVRGAIDTAGVTCTYGKCMGGKT